MNWGLGELRNRAASGYGIADVGKAEEVGTKIEAGGVCTEGWWGKC